MRPVSEVRDAKCHQKENEDIQSHQTGDSAGFADAVRVSSQIRMFSRIWIELHHHTVGVRLLVVEGVSPHLVTQTYRQEKINSMH